MPLTNVLGNFFVIVLAGLGGWLALQGWSAWASSPPSSATGRTSSSPLRQLANMYNAIQAALAGAERVFEIIDTPAGGGRTRPMPCPWTRCAGDVRFERRRLRLRARHAGHQGHDPGGRGRADRRPGGADRRGQDDDHQPADPLLRDRRGQHHASTATISATIKKADLRRQLGIVLQDTFLFSDTVMENIRYGRLDATDEECIAGRAAGRRRPLHPPAAAGLPDRALGARPATSARGSASCWPSPAPSWPTPAS